MVLILSPQLSRWNPGQWLEFARSTGPVRDSGRENLVAGANRTWFGSDLRYKGARVKIFDFAAGDPAPIRCCSKINEFKRGFGGEVCAAYELKNS